MSAPLPLTPFEQYMFTDDRPDYPMTFVFTLRFSGRIDREAFEAALAETVSRHPLLRALVDRSGGGVPCWVPAAGQEPRLDWADTGVPMTCPGGERIDLTSEPGLRVWVRRGADGADLTMQFHHACCDGVGAMAFMGDLLAAYGARTASGDRRPAPRAIEVHRLSEREHLGPIRTSFLATAREALKWAWHRPAPLNPPSPSPPPARGPSPFPGFQCHTLGEEDSRRLHAAAGRQGATLNDLLLRDMFLTIHAWNRRHRSARPPRRLRILMPTNLRTGEDDRLPAANVVTMSFLTRGTRECEDPKRLLEGIRQETNVIKLTRRGIHFLRGLRFLQAIGGLPRLLAGQRCFATVVLSNLGEIGEQLGSEFPREGGKIVAGNVVLEGMAGSPPIRPKTRAALFIHTYRDRITVSVRCDPSLFTTDDTRELLELYVARLEETP
jgi:hypothetical protein